VCAFLARLAPAEHRIAYACYDHDVATGLDVLAADEFPDALRGWVHNLGSMEGDAPA
tara:strand:- start:77 stop:247 length:171 start_codon:yes stop_codon:yes gene_type:complete